MGRAFVVNGSNVAPALKCGRRVRAEVIRYFLRSANHETGSFENWQFSSQNTSFGEKTLDFTRIWVDYAMYLHTLCRVHLIESWVLVE